MADLVRDFDWGATPVGPLSTWQHSLRSAAATCLHSPFQMAIYWGPELNCIYNDAERDVLGELHPRALGLSARELLREIWDIVGPQLQAVLESGATTWRVDQPFELNRRGKVERGYFTYSYSPIIDDGGGVGGVLLVTHETTARILAERRLEVLRVLAERTIGAPDALQAHQLAAQALGESEDVAFALIYTIDQSGTRAQCVASAGDRLARGRVSTQVELNNLPAEATAAIQTEGVGGLPGAVVTTSEFLALRAGDREMAQRAFLAPLVRARAEGSAGFIVIGLGDRVRFDDSYESFLKMAAAGVGRSVAAAAARQSEHEQRLAIAATDRAKTELFHNVSHELRTPLTLILAQLEQLLEQTALTDELKGEVRVARRNASRMLRLVNALLEVSRLRAGSRTGAFRPTEIAQVTRDLAAMFESTAQRAGIDLSIDCPPLGQQVYVDVEAWEDIVSNLVSNALKFTPAGKVEVCTRAEDGHLRLTVEDTGIGIPLEDRERIFSRFYRSQDPRARTQEGSGIGLALVRELVRMHGGSIEANPRPGGGTTMVVRVPTRGDGAPRAVVADDESHPTVGRAAALSVADANAWLDDRSAIANPKWSPVPGTSERQAASRKHIDGAPRVLVAEDSGDMREYLRRLLSPHFAVELAVDGADAREAALGAPPDLVISDVMMPGLDGLSLLRELRDDPRTRQVPVMLLSAQADSESTMRALDLGADDYIIKPFGARELLARARATLENSRVRADAAAAQGRAVERREKDKELRALINDLRAAQRRVAAAGDAERRHIERNLHDGAQQRLISIQLELGLLDETFEQDQGAAREMLKRLRSELEQALQELRDLAHGVYPPLLASDGLYAALRAAADRCAIPVSVHATEAVRAPRSVESAVYFCCLEALQNVAKHAGPGARASVKLEMGGGGVLEFRVEDDGKGFDSGAVRPGNGLINLRDRLEALGGRFEITSTPGRGTTVAGQVPLP